MRIELQAILWSIALFASCVPRDATATDKTVAPSQTGSEQSAESTIRYSVEQSELTDRTVSEEHFEHPSYGNGNGTVLSYSEMGGKKIWKRKFVDVISVQTYEFTDRQFLYAEPDGQKVVCAFFNDIKLTTVEMRVVQSDNPKSTECWLKVTDTAGHEGWVYVGAEDPYLNDNWAIVGSVQADGKKLLLRKYNSEFSVWEPQAAYDEPSTSGTVLWHSLRTDSNSQINFDAICVTDETYQGKYFSEHWVKVKDSYGRIGWFPGDTLEVERGGPKYLTPEAMVERSFYEA